MKPRTIFIGLVFLVVSLACGSETLEPENPGLNTQAPPTRPATDTPPTPMDAPTLPPELPTLTQTPPPSLMPTNTPLPPTNTPTLTPVPPAGWLTLEKDLVEHGQTLSTLERLIDIAPFFGGDFLRVTDRGQVLMEIDPALWLRLFNGTELDVVQVEAAENTPFDVVLALADGGFTGQFEGNNGQVVIETPNGVITTITGTSFFVSYDPDTGQTAIANFDGLIVVEDGVRPFVVSPELWAIAPSGSGPQPFNPITFEEFDRMMQNANAPLDGDDILACADFENLDLSAIRVSGGFDLNWSSSGGCGPYDGTITATYLGENQPYATYQISEPSGSIFDDPPTQCEGTFTIIFEITLTDALGRELRSEAQGEVTFIC